MPDESPTPAKIAARQRLNQIRMDALTLYNRASAILAHTETLSLSAPPTDEEWNRIRRADATLSHLPLEWLVPAAHDDWRPPTWTQPEGHPGWPELRRQLLMALRPARWLWAHESEVRAALEAHQWTAKLQDSLAGAILRVTEVAKHFGYPGEVSDSM